MAASKAMKGKVVLALALLLLVIDQIVKIEVKTNMCLHESIKVFDWFYILFIENEGMAYGATFINKFVLTSFRFVAVIVIGWYIVRQVAKGAKWKYLICLTLVVTGALGNLIDCLFYGKVFSESTPYEISQFVSWGEGYADMFYGKVVDMFYFPIINTVLPEWVPFYGGEQFIFFSPIFNFADSCITVGVVALLLFCRKELAEISFFSNNEENEKSDEEENEASGEESEDENIQEPKEETVEEPKEETDEEPKMELDEDSKAEDGDGALEKTSE